MRSARVLSVVGVASILAAVGCSSPESSEFASSSQSLLTEPLLNEVVFNPPSTDQPYEFIELRGPANASLSGYSLAYIEGDANTNVGKAVIVFPLSGGTIGSNGLFVLKATTGHAVPAGTGSLTDARLESAGQLQNDSGTIILVKGTALVESTDYDTNNDGVLDLPVGTTLLDSVSISSATPTGTAFGPLVTAQSGTPDAVSRFADDDRANTAAAWYGGDVSGTVSTDLVFSTTACTLVIPTGAAVTPGAPNSVRGAVSDAGVTDAGSASTDAGSVQDASVAVDSGSAADAGPGVDASFPVTSSDPLINELEINPGGTDNPYEYIELKGTPGSSLTPYQLVYVEGDSGSQLGVAKLVFSLTGATFGSAGFLVIKSNLGGHTLPAGCNLQSDNVFDVTNGGLENGTGTFLLVRGTRLTQSTDYDTNDDGVLDLPTGAVIVDAIATTDNGSTDKAHAPTVKNANGSQPAGLSRLVGNTLRSDATAWFGATLSGVQSVLVYDAATCTANMPVGAALTPGAENSQGAAGPVDAGAPVVDAGPRDAGSPVVDAGPRDAGSPVADAGPRDSGAPVADAGTAVDAGSPPVADAGTKVDAGSKSDAGSPAEQTFGDDEGKACSCTVVGSTRTRTAPFAWAVLAGFVGLVAARRRR
jgi:hypothetical protein